LLSQAAVEKYGDRNVGQIATELGVSNVVTGSVRRDRDRLRVLVELLDTSTQQTLWSEQYDRELADVFAVQSDIALRVARALSASLSPGERARLDKRPTSNAEAYQLYLRANERSFRLNREMVFAGNALLKQALALDPTFAAAKARLAYRTLFLSDYGSPKYVDEAITLAQEAIRLDPALAYGHFALGTAYYLKGRYAQARLSLLRALELEPSHIGSMENSRSWRSIQAGWTSH
jgi:tetratricopeptide (TPR) repeat protein